MAAAHDRIREVLAEYGETYNTGKGGNVWDVQGTPVIAHRCLERIAAKAKITFDQPTVLRCERDEAVILVTGMIPTGRNIEDNQPDAPDWVHGPTFRTEWSIGEALVNVNYRVSGKQAAYVYAMAEKRAKDRVILKLVELHGLAYSEEEADEFKGKSAGLPDPLENDPEIAVREFIEGCRKRIADAKDTATLAAWWNGDGHKQAFRDFELNDAERAELGQLVANRVEDLRPRAVS